MKKYLLDNPFPVDYPRLDDLIDLEHDASIIEVAVQIIHMGIHAQRVHPVSKHWKRKIILVVLPNYQGWDFTVKRYAEFCVFPFLH